MTTLIGIPGSLRKGSYNHALLRAAAAMTPEGAELRIEAIHDIPLYDGDVEASQGVPPSVARLKDAVARADGLLLATPEYNNAMPGVLKNAIDWMSRPNADAGRVFGGKPVALMGASPGGFGTVLSQNSWLPVFRTLGMRPWFEGRLMVSRAQNVFDADGNIIDPAIQAQLQQFIAGFAAFCVKESK